MKHQLDEWSLRLSALHEKATKADGLAKVELFKAVDTLGRAQRAATRHFEQVSAMPPEALGDEAHRRELVDGWNKVSATVAATWKRFELR